MADCVGHKEYSTEGKIDPAGIHMPAFRAAVQAYINGHKEIDDMSLSKLQDVRLYQIWVQTADVHPVRQVFQKVFYNVKDGKLFTRAGLADVWNEVVWDGFVNPVDLLDGAPDPDQQPAAPNRARRGSLISYVLATYREATLANRRSAAFIYALERQGYTVDHAGLHLPETDQPAR